VLCMRVRGVPTPGQIQSIWPFESLAVMVLTWAGVWLLSTSQPDGRAARIPGVLRLLVTVECLLLSLQRLGLLEDIALVRRWSEPAQYACDVLVAALLGAHLCLVSSRLRLGGVGWRIGLALPLRAGVVLAMLLVPRLISAFIAAPYRLSWEFWNFRSALFVLTAGLCALAMFRFALALRRSAASG
ncbi:MAG: hypothetical protein ACREJC_12725, partial [Tepidisphaeraceae bacterium]